MSNIPIVVAVGDVDVLITLDRRLAGAGFTVLACCDSETFFDLIMRHKPALLLADWEIPGMTGVELCRKIRQSEFNTNVYVIILTPHAAEEPIVAGLEAGAADYLTKPARAAELLARVQAGTRVLHLLRERKEQASKLNKAKERLCSEIEARERTKGLLWRIQRALDDSADAIAVVDEDGKVGYINISFADLFHCTLDIINEAGWESLFVDRTIYTSILNSTAVGSNWSDQAQMLSRKERRFPAEIRATPVVNERIEIAGLMLLVNDITERKRLEHELLHTRKLESIGRLAAGVAHEINTPTQYIGDNARFVQKGFADLSKVLQQYAHLLAAAKEGGLRPELVLEVERAVKKARVDYLYQEIPEAIAEALEGIDRVAEIVRAMKEFSYPGVEGKTETDINKAIQSTVTVATNEWKYVADVKMNLDPDLPQVRCFVGEFDQVILNILVNAAHAIKEVVGDGSGGKGSITVSTHHQGDWAEIRIQDPGPGIAEDVRASIFDPFFTTKGVGQGTGQGLSMANAVITKKHGGTISVDSPPGKGATFIIRLPISAAPTDMETTKEVAIVL